MDLIETEAHEDLGNEVQIESEEGVDVVTDLHIDFVSLFCQMSDILLISHDDRKVITASALTY